MNQQDSPELPIEADPSAVEQISQPVAEPTGRFNDLERELALTLQQMRTQVCALGVSCVIISLALSLFVWNQNGQLSRAAANRTQRTEQIQQSLELWMPALNELAAYSSANPELRAIFTRHGLRLEDESASPGGPAPQ